MPPVRPPAFFKASPSSNLDMAPPAAAGSSAAPPPVAPSALAGASLADATGERGGVAESARARLSAPRLADTLGLRSLRLLWGSESLPDPESVEDPEPLSVDDPEPLPVEDPEELAARFLLGMTPIEDLQDSSSETRR